MEELVSIIMPAYNAEKYISQAIQSVIEQTYKKWELIIIDDCSSDNTLNIVKLYAKKDERIKYTKQSSNYGAAKARNIGIEMSKGDYIAFLDSDDLWRKEKLEKQITFMKENNLTFTCTYYDKIDENSNSLNIVVKYKKEAVYNELLKSSPGNSTVIYNSKKLGKIYARDIKRRNDYVLWLDVIKRSKGIWCLDEVLGSHRIREGSISSKKLKLVKYHWYIYREFENINVFKSIYLVMYWCLKGILQKLKQF